MDNKDKENIKYLRETGKSYEEVSQILGINRNTVKSYCKRAGIKGIMIIPDGKVRCLNCNNVVSQNSGRKKKKFCNDKCRLEWWNSHRELVQHKNVEEITCICCGSTFKASGNKTRKYCCQRCYFIGRFGGGVRFVND